MQGIPRGKRYRDTALECYLAAEGMAAPERRLGLLELARQWMRLSRRAEVGVRETPGSPDPGRTLDCREATGQNRQASRAPTPPKGPFDLGP